MFVVRKALRNLFQSREMRREADLARLSKKAAREDKLKAREDKLKAREDKLKEQERKLRQREKRKAAEVARERADMPPTPTGDEIWGRRKEECFTSDYENRFDIARMALRAKVPSERAALWLLRWTWDLHGPSMATLHATRKIKNQLSRLNQAERLDDFLMAQASLNAHAGLTGDAVLSVMDLKETRGEQWICNKTSLALTALMADYGLFTSGRANCAAKIMDSASKSVGRFEDIVLGAKSICVVGNSPKEIGKGQGAFVDSHDVVIRFNNFSTDFDYAMDYGKKTTIWIKATGYRDIWRRAPSRFDLIVFSGPDRRFHELSGGSEVVEHAGRGEAVDFIPSRIFSDVAGRIGSPPSAGITILHWLRLLKGPLNSAGVSHIGFGFTDQLANKSRNYFGNVTSKEFYPHNWSAEEQHYREFIE